MSLFHLDVVFDTKLIDLIKANPILYEWDLRFKDMKEKVELWSPIAASLNRNTKYCISRWMSLQRKYHCEVRKFGKGSRWHLFGRMKFIDKNIKYQGTQRNLTTPEHQMVPCNINNMDADQLIEDIVEADEDDPLQEDMDEQITPETSKGASLNASVLNNAKKHIGALLEGLDEKNQCEAHQRIVAYSLNDASIQGKGNLKTIVALLEGLGEET